jgi:hypothetical protein
MAEELCDSDDEEVTALTAEIRGLKVERRVRRLTLQLTTALVAMFLIIAFLVWGFTISAPVLVLGSFVFGKCWTDLRVTSRKLFEVSRELEVLQDDLRV